MARVRGLEVFFGVEGALGAQDEGCMGAQAVFDHGLDHVAPCLSPLLASEVALVVREGDRGQASTTRG